MSHAFVDIHCHLLPGVDDGSPDLATTLAMAKMAVESGTRAMILTPHQLGANSHNHGDDLRRKTAELQHQLEQTGSCLQVLPGADVRIEDGMFEKLASGEVLTLADRKRHVLLELPHELYFPLEGLLEQLKRMGLVGILSHPERNEGLLRDPGVLPGLVDAGCLMQVTAGSLVGGMGKAPQKLAEWMVAEGLVHFLATDAHGLRARRPRMHHAFKRLSDLAGEEMAIELCCDNPAMVAAGEEVAPGRRKPQTSLWQRLFSPRRVA
ncbi:tyrosine-protein phosphatase [Adhaeretor mobilis]|nr:CpsB/CapC family capsule biosynthesis tyrosine phosphatase [Adhaeretor mobilis]